MNNEKELKALKNILQNMPEKEVDSALETSLLEAVHSLDNESTKENIIQENDKNFIRELNNQKRNRKQVKKLKTFSYALMLVASLFIVIMYKEDLSNFYGGDEVDLATQVASYDSNQEELTVDSGKEEEWIEAEIKEESVTMENNSDDTLSMEGTYELAGTEEQTNACKKMAGYSADKAIEDSDLLECSPAEQDCDSAEQDVDSVEGTRLASAKIINISIIIINLLKIF